MDRREFLKQVAAYSAGASLAVPLFQLAQARAAETAGSAAGTAAAPAAGPAAAGADAQPIIVVAKGKDYGKLVTEGMSKLGGMGRFVQPGQKVVIKPNIGWDRKPETGANTHPEVVKALAVLALDAKAGSVQVFDRTCMEARRSYANSGIKSAVESIGDGRVTCPYVDDRQFVPVKIANGKAVTEWRLHRDALEADVYINAPVAKHHGLTKLTLGMKNTMGICGGSRGQLHQQIALKLADINGVIRPKLTVIDCTRYLFRNGPSGGNVKDVKVLDTVVISADPVAADAYAAQLLGFHPTDIEPTVAASRAGLGEIDLSRCKIVEIEV